MATRGRPRKFSCKAEIGKIKKNIKQLGLMATADALRVEGIVVSLATLSRLARSGRGGTPPVKLKRGRRPQEV
jgi:hypothetical protein